ncbi:hypothetical protein FHW16_004834 [Phyllobacterium myrsinacearum]|uniref:Uncharacterized protein n=1 Tax=Phyllobacterium myrsinacearum TaxID=28101 RepID=A0A839EQD4_9HYPH|nr:hypothetical protein [Phyllobacterium myrsinacearum]
MIFIIALRMLLTGVMAFLVYRTLSGSPENMSHNDK